MGQWRSLRAAARAVWCAGRRVVAGERPHVRVALDRPPRVSERLHPLFAEPAAGLPFRRHRSTAAPVAVDGGTCFFSADGTTACWAAESPMQLAGADGTVCRLARDGGVTCDGSNFNGRLGTGDAVQIHRPVDIASGPVRKVAMSQWQGCALERAGTVRCWGTDPTTFAISPPTPLSGLLPLARSPRLRQPTLLRARRRQRGLLLGLELVEPARSRRSVESAGAPVPMPDRVEQLAASGDTTCARLRSGEVWCWGDNQDAQLGFDAAAPLGGAGLGHPLKR